MRELLKFTKVIGTLKQISKHLYKVLLENKVSSMFILIFVSLKCLSFSEKEVLHSNKHDLLEVGQRFDVISTVTQHDWSVTVTHVLVLYSGGGGVFTGEGL